MSSPSSISNNLQIEKEFLASSQNLGSQGNKTDTVSVAIDIPPQHHNKMQLFKTVECHPSTRFNYYNQFAHNTNSAPKPKRNPSFPHMQNNYASSLN